MSETRFNLLSFSGNTRILHCTWIAFFLSFVMWFNHAPLLATLRETFALTDQQVKTLLILNVALTIPVRILVGMLVDRLGPRIMFTLLLALGGVFCLGFALADTYEQLALARFLLGFVGAGFVIGVRMIGEWFPARHVGLAEGIYAGWGNFGSAAAAMTLPALALAVGGPNGWRWAVAASGVLAMIWAVVWYRSVTDTPKGSTYFKAKKLGAMEVTSRGDLLLYFLANIPLYAALGVLVWKLGPGQLALFGPTTTGVLYAIVAALWLWQSVLIVQINRAALARPIPDLHRYRFSQVAVLDVVYLVAFGSELAVVSMLPLFFKDTFGLDQWQAGLMASVFGTIVILARPGGGLLSDRIGRRTSILIALGGLTLGYALMSRISADWHPVMAMLVTLGCALFVHLGTGATFAMVPLIKRRLTGQIAGQVGAYGNVGGVAYLTLYSFVGAEAFFLAIAASALVTLAVVALWLREPAGHMAEVLPDGTVQLIEVG